MLRVKASPVVLNLEVQRPIILSKVDHDLGGVRIFLHVLECLEHAEVHGRLHVLGISLNRLGVHVHRDRRLAGL